MTTATKGFFGGKTDAAIFTDEYSLKYLTGIHFTAGVIVISKSSRMLYVDGRYFDKATRLLGRKWKIRKLKRDISVIEKDLWSKGVRTAYVDTDKISVARYRAMAAAFTRIKIADAAGLSSKVRMIKRPDELDSLQEAVRLTDVLWARVLPQVAVGMTERELLALIKYEAHSIGAESMSFEPIVATGIATAEPHAEASDRVIQGDTPLMVDMGIHWESFCSDFTRTVYLLNKKARAPKWFLTLHKEVFQIQNLAYSMLEAGERRLDVILKKIDDRLVRKKLKKYYLHGLGHGVGLEIHEEPSLAAGSGTILRNGMVFTVEPGLYRPGLGGVRIEDMVTLKKGKLVHMTNSPKDPEWRI